MQNQMQEQWEREHSQKVGFTAMHTTKPSQAVPAFADFLVQCGYQPAQTHIMDIGCGKGRNSVYLASRGFNVIATDFSQKALDDAKQRSIQYLAQVQYELVDLTQEWPFGTNHFDAMIDCNSTIYIPDKDRPHAIAEAFRTLKPGGYYLFYGIADTRQTVPGVPLPAETAPAYAVTPSFTEKHYTEEELKQAYGAFALASFGPVTTTDHMNGKDVINTLWVAVFQKPL